LDSGWFSAPEIRAERDRTFHICTDCRVCVKLCPSFKSLFERNDYRCALAEGQVCCGMPWLDAAPGPSVASWRGGME
jgi:Fe-S oxidoreductase